MFDLDDAWVWDFWLAWERGEHHLFFLHAPRSLGDPDLRHEHARVGHAVGTDLVHWERLPDPLPDRVTGFDDLAQWTGCVVHDGTEWWLFTTGRTHADSGRVQRIGTARSRDLRQWRRTAVVVEADPRWYDTAEDDAVAWRDPWVLRDESGTWHLLATARAGGPGSGVIGHATSRDLQTWTVHPALSEPTGRFEWLEVIQVAVVEGRTVALFNCLSADMVGAPRGSGGVWTLPVDGAGSRVDVATAVRLTDESHYVGKLVAAPEGAWQLLSFRNLGPDGRFLGGVTDPVPVRWRADGRGLEVRGGRGAATPLV